MSNSEDSYESDSDTGMELATHAGETVAGQSLKTVGRGLDTMELRSLASAQHNEDQQSTPGQRVMDKFGSLVASHAKRICSAPTFDAAKSLDSLLKSSIDKQTTVKDVIALATVTEVLEAERQKVHYPAKESRNDLIKKNLSLMLEELRGRMVPKTPAMHAIYQEAAPTPDSPGALARERRPLTPSPQNRKHTKTIHELSYSALSPMSHESESVQDDIKRQLTESFNLSLVNLEDTGCLKPLPAGAKEPYLLRGRLLLPSVELLAMDADRGSRGAVVRVLVDGKEMALKMSLFGFAPRGHGLLFNARVLNELAANQRCELTENHHLLRSILTAAFTTFDSSGRTYILSVILTPWMQATLTGPLAAAVCQSMYVEVANATVSGVAAMHHAGTLHNDLKLDNVFVGTCGTLKLGDLSHGAVLPHGAKVVDGEATDYDRPHLGFTAPEQLMGGRPSMSTDVYNLSSMLLNVVLGLGHIDSLVLAHPDNAEDEEAAQLKALKSVYFVDGDTDGVPRQGLELVASMMKYKGLTLTDANKNLLKYHKVDAWLLAGLNWHPEERPSASEMLKSLNKYGYPGVNHDTSRQRLLRIIQQFEAQTDEREHEHDEDESDDDEVPARARESQHRANMEG